MKKRKNVSGEVISIIESYVIEGMHLKVSKKELAKIKSKYNGSFKSAGKNKIKLEFKEYGDIIFKRSEIFADLYVMAEKINKKGKRKIDTTSEKFKAVDGDFYLANKKTYSFLEKLFKEYNGQLGILLDLKNDEEKFYGVLPHKGSFLIKYSALEKILENYDKRYPEEICHYTFGYR